MSAKKTLDRSRPFATISSLKPQKQVYEQDGLFFDQDELQCGETPGLTAKKKADEAKAKKTAVATKKKKTAEKALDLLGLGDKEAEQENAAAKHAEKLADD